MQPKIYTGADRGAAEMVLMYISACQGMMTWLKFLNLYFDGYCIFSLGEWSDMVIGTLDLGISILRGGNVDIQKVKAAW